MSITIVRTLPEEEWRRFVEGHPAGNIFHTPEMFQVFTRAKGHQPTLWAAVDSNNRTLALLLPVQVTLMNGLLRQFTTRAVAYGSVLCAPGTEGQEALTLLLRTYKREVKGSPLFTELRNLSDLSDIQSILQQHGYVREAHENFLINLNLPVEEVWHNIKKSARKKIRHALKKDQLTIKEVYERGQIATWYRLLQKTYCRTHVPLADPSLFHAAFDILRPKGMAQFLLGRVDDTCAAASVALLYKNVIYGWYRGFDRKYSPYLPNDLMVWHLLQWGATNGYQVFDFGGAGRPNEDYGPRRFKAKFGGEVVEFGRNTYVHSRLRLWFSQVGYRLYHQLP